MSNKVKSDIEIASKAEILPVTTIAEHLGLDADALELYGKYKAKLSYDTIHSLKDKEPGKLVLVTAINPTPAGEGKSTVTVGLGDALSKKIKRLLSHCANHHLDLLWGLKAGQLVAAMRKLFQWKILIYTLQAIFMQLQQRTMLYRHLLITICNKGMT